MVDSHCHLQHERFDGDLEAVLARAVEAGIERIMVPGWDIQSSEAALDLARLHAPLLQAAVGVHPHHAGDTDEPSWRTLEGLIADPHCSAVGEIGLDFYRNLSTPDVQRSAFGRQLSLAAVNELPVLVHDRDAHQEVAAILSRWAEGSTRSTRGVLHAFSGDGDMATRLTARGFLVSFAFPLSFRSAAGPRTAAASVPAGAYLVETDSPYLGPDRAGRNEPTTALRVVAELARLREMDPQMVANDVRAAYDRLVVI